MHLYLIATCDPGEAPTIFSFLSPDKLDPTTERQSILQLLAQRGDSALYTDYDRLVRFLDRERTTIERRELAQMTPLRHDERHWMREELARPPLAAPVTAGG